MEENKSSEGFAKEVIEAFEGAFDNGFNSCKSLVGKLFPNLDLSSVIWEASLALPSEMEAQTTPKMGPTAKAPQPVLEVPTVLLVPKVEAFTSIETPAAAPTEAPAPNSKPAEVPASIEVISLEDDTTAIPTQASQADA
ncbi:hypothetical protein COCNU_16G001470 [Cocos nucifera]|uniref:Uncharacterized protein n=1 Tax=Cocos nucifera TaxID=13894 RepID=A0A8K0IZT8_COCNU|nr:hypothetical protein COCNU_16G001470 [Cocos nucifera]